MGRAVVFFRLCLKKAKIEESDLVLLAPQFLYLGVLTVVFGFFLSACGQNGRVSGKAVPPSKAPVEVAENLTDVQAPPILRSLSLEVKETSQADILIVIDNSASMRYEQASMAQRFGSLLDELKALDWRLGIITTDVSSDSAKKDGRLLEFEGMPGVFYLTSEMAPGIMKAAFSKTIQRPSREGDPNEQGVKATYRFLEREPKWLREGSPLNVIVVTDADETPPRGAKPDARNNPSVLLNYVNTKYSGKPFFFHSIIVKDGDHECLKVEDPKTDDNEGFGLTYAWLSKKTGGVIGSVCAKNYASQLKTIGERVSQRIRSATLDCSPLSSSIVLKNDHGYSMPQYFVVGRRLNFKEPLPPGLNVIDYRCANLDPTPGQSLDRSSMR